MSNQGRFKEPPSNIRHTRPLLKPTQVVANFQPTLGPRNLGTSQGSTFPDIQSEFRHIHDHFARVDLQPDLKLNADRTGVKR